MTTIEDWDANTDWGTLGRLGSISFGSGGTMWPAGINLAPAISLQLLLARSGRWHARLAIAGFVSNELDVLLQSAVSAGTAVELMTKAYVVSVSPALLADRGDRDSLLHLMSHGAKAKKGATALKSVGAQEALAIAGQLQPGWRLPLQDAVSLRARNAAAHMALVEGNELQLAVIQMCTVVEYMLSGLRLDREKFWDEHQLEVVDSLLNEAHEAITVTVQAKFARARAYLSSLTFGLDEERIAGLFATLTARPVWDEQEVAVECPICHQQGQLIYFVEWVPSVPDSGINDDALGFGDRFYCSVCRLSLDSGAELDEAGIDTDVEFAPYAGG